MTRRGGFIPLLPTTPITTALAGVAQASVGEGAYDALQAVESATFQATFVYGSGGTTAKAYVETSLDGGASWCDVASFAFTTASAVKISSVTGDLAPAAQAYAPTDGALTDNTVAQGALGNLWRVKLLTTGTYANTTIAVAMIARG